MHDEIRTALRAFGPLSDEAWASVAAALASQPLEAGEVFVREGEVARRTAIVVHGIVRYYSLRDGREHVTGFDAEGSLAGDFASFFQAAPSASTIEAIEPCVLGVLTFDAFETLARQFPMLEAARAVVAEQLLAGARTRSDEAVQLSAEARYRLILDRSPHLVQRVPLYHIASYLGVTPEALSRIRRRI